jgi:hypothetical protein
MVSLSSFVTRRQSADADAFDNEAFKSLVF